MDLPRTAQRTLDTSGAALLVAAFFASSVQAAPPDTLPALKQFTAAGNVLDVTLTMNRAPGPTMIGRDQAENAIAVDALATLTVCDSASPGDCAHPYAGAVLKLSPGDALNARLINGLGGSGGSMAQDCMDMTAPWDAAIGWSSIGGLINQHFHGLLVPPTAGAPGNPAEPFGDYIFTCTMGSGGAAERNYQMLLATGHPTGIDWYHPHIHGIAKPQVSSGMAGMILVGDPKCVDSSGQPASCGAVRPILLKDAQLVKVPGADGTPHWLNFADQDPGFCDGSTFSPSNLGSCPLPANAQLTSGGTALAPIEGHWVFTLNGAQYPTIVVPDAQVWRVQNASANVTYRLSLRQLNADAAQVVADAPFDVLSMDGAGLAGSAGGGQFAPQAREILLMPGSRADLRVSRPADAGAGELSYQLVNEAFQAGFAQDDADVWPRIALARVIFPASPATAAAGVPALRAAPASGVLHAKRAQRAPAANRVRVRVPVQESGAARLRGTPLSRGAELAREPSAPAIPPAPQDETTRAAAPAGAATATPDNRQFAMARWLREDCDGYSAHDALAEVDALLQTALPGHQPIGSELQRRLRYWNSLHFDTRTTHRRLYFGIQDADGDERFVLGETLVVANRNASGPSLIETDLYGRRIGPTNPVVLTTFNAEKGLCVLKRRRDPADALASVEQWELVNVSAEVHNFHIHQMKFTVARDVNGQAIMRTPSPADLVQLPASLLLTAGGGAPAELQHDTIVVPRGVTACGSSLKPLGSVNAASGSGSTSHPVEAFMLDRSGTNPSCTGLDAHQSPTPVGPRPAADGSGMILVNLSFDGDWLEAARDGDNKLQPARFVFHCHILEHEDKGMMHRIAVLDPTPSP